MNPKPRSTAEHRKAILEDVERCILRDRNATHGEAEDVFSTLAEYWTTHLRARGLLAEGKVCATEDAVIMLALLKMARLAQTFAHMDNWVDGSGYLACGGGIALAKKSRAASAEVAAGGAETISKNNG